MPRKKATPPPAADPPKRTRAKPKAVAKGQSTPALHQLKIALQVIRPEIWRRVHVPDLTLYELHVVIQIAMGWQNSHLHDFTIGKVKYGEPNDWVENEDEDKVKLSAIVGKHKKFTYQYDFGDSWEHTITVEKSPVADPETTYPAVVDGAGACPPEDCGGYWGYADFVEAMTNPKHERHKELKEWYGGKYDPEAFDLVATNALMRQVFKGKR